jgi:hypothetical protein
MNCVHYTVLQITKATSEGAVSFPLAVNCHFPLRFYCKRVGSQIILKRLLVKLNIVTCCVTSLSCVSDRGHAQPGITNHHQHIQQNPVQR